MPLTSAQEASLGRRLNNLAASLHARSAVPLVGSAGGLSLAGVPPHSPSNFTGSMPVATPQLLATYGITASQIAPGTDVLTSRPGLAGLPHMQLTWPSSGNGSVPDGSSEPAGISGPSCTLSNDCLAGPAMQTVSSLPGGTDAPNTVITEYAMSKYQLQPSPNGWLIQTPAPLTAAQISAARHLALGYEVTVETKTDGPSLGEFADGLRALHAAFSSPSAFASVLASGPTPSRWHRGRPPDPVRARLASTAGRAPSRAPDP